MTEPNKDNPCPELKFCAVALHLEKIYGDIKSQLSSGAEIMRAQKAAQESFCDRVEKILNKQDQLRDDLDKRVGSVEKKVWYASGAASVISAGVAAFITKIFGGGHG